LIIDGTEVEYQKKKKNLINKASLQPILSLFFPVHIQRRPLIMITDVDPISIKLAIAVTGLSTAAYYIKCHQDSLPSRFVSALWTLARHWTRYCKVSFDE
jgi:hypothetical protein